MEVQSNPHSHVCGMYVVFITRHLGSMSTSCSIEVRRLLATLSRLSSSLGLRMRVASRSVAMLMSLS